jgi:hypothetical protein
VRRGWSRPISAAGASPIPQIKLYRAVRFAKRNLRNPLAIYGFLAVAGAALVVLAVAPMTSTVVQRWSERDVQLRSRLVFNSIRDQVAASLGTPAGANLVPFLSAWPRTSGFWLWAIAAKAGSSSMRRRACRKA